MTRPTVREQVQALIDRRHGLGERYQMKARLKLADALGVSEMTVRNWTRGAKPLPMAARAIQRLYDREVGSNG